MASVGVNKMACHVSVKLKKMTSLGVSKMAWVQGVDFLEEQVFPFF